MKIEISLEKFRRRFDVFKSPMGLCLGVAVLCLIVTVIHTYDLVVLIMILSGAAGLIFLGRKHVNTIWLKIIASSYPGLATVVILFGKDRIFANSKTGVEYIRYFLNLEYDKTIINSEKYFYYFDPITTIYLVTIPFWMFYYA